MYALKQRSKTHDAVRAGADFLRSCSIRGRNLRCCSSTSRDCWLVLGLCHESSVLLGVFTRNGPRSRAGTQIPAHSRAGAKIVGLCSSTTVDSCHESSRGRESWLVLEQGPRIAACARAESEIHGRNRAAVKNPGSCSGRTGYSCHEMSAATFCMQPRS